MLIEYMASAFLLNEECIQNGKPLSVCFTETISLRVIQRLICLWLASLVWLITRARKACEYWRKALFYAGFKGGTECWEGGLGAAF
jgi:hypothetical protein